MNTQVFREKSEVEIFYIKVGKKANGRKYYILWAAALKKVHKKKQNKYLNKSLHFNNNYLEDK